MKTQRNDVLCVRLRLRRRTLQILNWTVQGFTFRFGHRFDWAYKWWEMTGKNVSHKRTSLSAILIIRMNETMQSSSDALWRRTSWIKFSLQIARRSHYITFDYTSLRSSKKDYAVQIKPLWPCSHEKPWSDRLAVWGFALRNQSFFLPIRCHPSGRLEPPLSTDLCLNPAVTINVDLKLLCQYSHLIGCRSLVHMPCLAVMYETLALLLHSSLVN